MDRRLPSEHDRRGSTGPCLYSGDERARLGAFDPSLVSKRHLATREFTDLRRREGRAQQRDPQRRDVCPRHGKGRDVLSDGLPTDVLAAIDDAAPKAQPKWPPYFYVV